MQQENNQVHALTYAGSGITHSIATPVEITNVATGQIGLTNGLWDTGATGSAITKSMASALGLVSFGKRKVRGVHGVKETDVYYVNITLNNKNITLKANVTECDELSSDNSIGLLIGMNIITMGDFAVTNYQGNTTMTFRVPSQQKIDFVSGMNNAKKNATTYYQSPIGWIEIQASHEAITSLVFCDERKNDECNDSAILTECVRQLDEYFAGRLTKFNLPVKQEGTEFQQNVWNALMDIPFGKIASYGDVANTLNNPKAVRAVGAANGKNKVWIVVPCHRVIGADGSLTGYAGGLDRKKWLLAHEAKVNLKPQTSNLNGEALNEVKPQTSN